MNEFIEKFRLKYPEAEDSEIFKFLKIYLLYQPAENNYEKSDFLFDERIPINRISWMGPYLQEEGDYKYSWLVENLKENIQHPWLSLNYLREIDLYNFLFKKYDLLSDRSKYNIQ